MAPLVAAVAKNAIRFPFLLPLFSLLLIALLSNQPCQCHMLSPVGKQPIPSGKQQCGGDGWQFWPERGCCVKLFPAKTGWTVAEFNCAYQGGHHISVRDIRENQFLADMAKDKGQVWLGAAQFGASRDYVWSDGTPFGFEHWQNNMRPNYHRGKKCSKLDASSGQWVQSCCKVPAASICQRPAPTLPAPIQEDWSALSNQEQQQFKH